MFNGERLNVLPLRLDSATLRNFWIVILSIWDNCINWVICIVTLGNSGSFKKVKHTYPPRNLPKGEIKLYRHIETQPQLLMAVLFVTVKYREQPLTGGWISKLWWPYSGLLFRFMFMSGGNHHNIVIISQLKIKHFLKKNNHWYALPDSWISKFISKWVLDQRKGKW